MKAEVVLDSTYNGWRITTMLVEMPVFLLPQLLTHKTFSRNALSQRAQTTSRMVAATETYTPELFFGTAQRGMSPGPLEVQGAEHLWQSAKASAVEFARQAALKRVAKQLANRLLMPFAPTRVLLTATDAAAVPAGKDGCVLFSPWESFFKLRCAPEAQAEIQKVANLMRDAYRASKPVERISHQPFAATGHPDISAARCARISYDKAGEPSERDASLAQRLKEDGHLSPFEHVAVAADGSWANFVGWRSRRFDLEWR